MSERPYVPPLDASTLWQCLILSADGVRTAHTLPVGDAWLHDESPDCPCQPQAIPVEGGTMYSHHSFDGREAVQWAKAVLGQIGKA